MEENFLLIMVNLIHEQIEEQIKETCSQDFHIRATPGYQIVKLHLLDIFPKRKNQRDMERLTS